MDTLAGGVSGIPLPIGTGGVAIGLAQQPGVRAGSFFKGQNEGTLKLRLSHCLREIGSQAYRQDRPNKQCQSAQPLELDWYDFVHLDLIFLFL